MGDIRVACGDADWVAVEWGGGYGEGMKRNDLESELAEISALGQGQVEADALLNALKGGLKHRSNFVVAKAAEVVVKRGVSEKLSDELVKAYERFCKHAVKSDPGCKAKIAVVDALREGAVWVESLYLDAARRRQMEPVWGGRVDTAGGLRCAGVNGLMAVGYGDVMNELAMLLGDEEREVRVGAARLLGDWGDAVGEPLLRLRVLCGEEDGEVLSELFGSILAVNSASGLDFVGRYLIGGEGGKQGGNEGGDDEVRRCAALAIGQSRNGKGLEWLVRSFEKELDAGLRETILMAMAMLRNEDGYGYLCDLIKDADERTAELAVRAMGIYYYDEKVREMVITAAEGREELDEVLREVIA
ncbi:HEAT repeat domain-containing protein [Poriferisphaera corsica]|uniref:HEAT repeat domain-containing protein n=1 Tax=Poriferisphaera corsica TaxID=2528020 RepID=UPI0011A0B4B1|nr:HEAT repeat domain-containing protein [Poriferisphaera corsica]